MRVLRITVLAACIAAAPAGAAPEQGLMWSESALPLVFPLQIRTDPGRDGYLVLTDAETGGEVLAAYMEGGRFFRVLVPPGTFRVHIAFGHDWQGEDALFGAATETYAYPEPLEFGVSGVARKSGHLLDLRGRGEGVEARAEALALCQLRRLDVDAFGGALPDKASRPDPLAQDSTPDPLDDDPYFRRRFEYDLRERTCG